MRCQPTRGFPAPSPAGNAGRVEIRRRPHPNSRAKCSSKDFSQAFGCAQAVSLIDGVEHRAV